MANCPNCGSSSIALTKEGSINWGRAIGGYFLFGIVGGAVGAVTGKDKDVIACLDCGTTWRAQELYQALQLIEKASGRKFNLSLSNDREYLRDFLNSLEHLNEKLEAQNKEADLLIKEAIEQTKNPTATTFGCSFGLFCLVIGLFFPGSNAFAGAVVGLSIGSILGVVVDVLKRPQRLKNLEKTKQRAEKMKQKAQQDIETSLVEIARKYR